MYSIGIATDPRPTDKRFSLLDEAEPAACDASEDGAVWATRDDENGEILSLAFQNRLFFPA